MKRSLALAVSAIALAAAAGTPALAQSEGPYVALGAGLVIPEESDLDGPTAATSGDVEFDNGWAAMIAGGYAWGNGLRTELEFSYRDTGVDGITTPGATNGDGSANALATMANVLYDFDFGIGLKPYLGAGIGLARVEAENWRNSAGAITDDGDISWAWQGIAGAAYGISDNVDLTLDYRYFSAPDLELSGAAAGTSYDTEYQNHTVMLGVRYTFGAPPAPAPQPAAAPAPAPQPEPVAQRPAPRDYLVFFEFDRANLTPEAQSVLNQAASTASNNRPAVINVTGHTDRAGSDQYNERLSMRRAEAVAAYLESQGVPRSAMALDAEGESQPLVPTADGAREPQNRRVMIRIQ